MKKYSKKISNSMRKYKTKSKINTKAKVKRVSKRISSVKVGGRCCKCYAGKVSWYSSCKNPNDCCKKVKSKK